MYKFMKPVDPVSVTLFEYNEEQLKTKFPVRRGKAVYEEINFYLNKPGSIVDNTKKYLNVDTEFYESETNNPYYVLLNMNLVLWLYELGNTRRESELFFIELAKGIRNAMKIKVEDNKMNIPISHFPITRNMRDHICKAVDFKNRNLREFVYYLALITGLCCCARGKARKPEVIVHDILSRAAPQLTQRTAPILIKAQKPDEKDILTFMYKTAYKEDKDKPWNMTLSQVMPMQMAKLLLDYLVERANKTLSSSRGAGNNFYDRQEFIRMILAYYRLTKNLDSIECLNSAILGGIKYIW